MRIALAAAGLAVVAATALMLLDSEPRQTGSNNLAPQQFSLTGPAAAGLCQREETLYEGTDYVRMTVATFGAPTRELELEFRREGATLASGRLEPGWAEGVVDIAIEPRPEESSEGVELCLRSPGGRLALGGEPVERASGGYAAGRQRPGRASVVSYASGESSRLGQLGQVTDRYGRGNAAWLGGWTLALAALLVAGGLVAAALALIDERRARRLAVGAGVALAAAWALVLPPFMVPDEPAHHAYVQGLVETGELPRFNETTADYSPRARDALVGLRFFETIGDTTSKPPWTEGEEQRLRAAEASLESRATRDAGTASSNPPLYYLAQAPVYAATRGFSVVEQQLPMRLLSVALGGVTVLLVFLLVQELMPRRPLAWATGAVATALLPLFTFVTAGVNADALLFALSAGTLLAGARLLRRGATVGRCATLGGVVAAGLLVKPLFVALVPAAAAAVVIAVARSPEPWRRRGVQLGAASAAAVLPVVAYSLIGDALSDHPYFPRGVSVAPSGEAAAILGEPTGIAGLRKQASYIWQLFLPRLPFMNDLFPEFAPLRNIWFDGLVGRFGWLDYGFGPRVTGFAVGVAFAVLALALAALARTRDLLARWPALVFLSLALVGVLGAIGTQQYQVSLTGADGYTQTRYLLPLLGTYGALIAVAVHGLGRRAAPILAIVVFALGAVHQVAALLLTVDRFYA